MARRTYAVTELFTMPELRRAQAIFDEHRRNTGFNQMLVDAVVRDALPRINEVTHQENDAKYFAYVLEAAFANGLRV